MNKKDEKFKLSKRLKSFTYAFNGLKVLIQEEHNARIHLVTTILIVAAGVFFKISISEWIAICFAIGFVFVTEILNSAIENLADYVSPQYHELIKKAKDLGAAAVFISAVIAVVIGGLIFLPKIFLLF